MRGFLSGTIAGLFFAGIGVVGASYVTGPSGPFGGDNTDIADADTTTPETADGVSDDGGDDANGTGAGAEADNPSDTAPTTAEDAGDGTGSTSGEASGETDSDTAGDTGAEETEIETGQAPPSGSEPEPDTNTGTATPGETDTALPDAESAEADIVAAPNPETADTNTENADTENTDIENTDRGSTETGSPDTGSTDTGNTGADTDTATPDTANSDTVASGSENTQATESGADVPPNAVTDPGPEPDALTADETPTVPTPETTPSDGDVPVVATPDAPPQPDLSETSVEAPDPEVGLEASTPLDPPPSEVDAPVVSGTGEENVALIDESPRPDAPNPEDTPNVATAEAPDPEVDLAAGAPIDAPETEEGADDAPAGEDSVAPLADVPLPDQPAAGTAPDVDANAPVALAETEKGPTIETPQVEIITPGILNDRLPRIGETGPDEETADEGAVGAEGDEAVSDADLPAIEAFAVPFEIPDGQAMMSVLLIDPGEGRVDPAELAGLPIPLSIAIDPTRADAREMMTAIRAAGHEVVVLTPLGADASPADVEQAFQVYFDTIPEAVAVLDVPEARLQENRPRAVQVAEILLDTGHGLITYPRGLNSGVQVASSAGVPAMIIFRDIDDGTRQISVMKRLLDVGAFRASQEKAVLVTGELRSAVITALTEWILSTRAATVTLAPVSATLKVR